MRPGPLLLLVPMLVACGPSLRRSEQTTIATAPPRTVSSENAAPAGAPATATATPEPEAAPSSSGPGAQCLHIGPHAVAVRCFWKREECESQVAFNTEQGLVGSQCKAIPIVHCFQYEKGGERCYTSAHDCATHLEGMKKVVAITAACAAKSGP